MTTLLSNGNCGRRVLVFLLKLDADNSRYLGHLKYERSFIQKLLNTEAIDDLVDVEMLLNIMQTQVELLTLEDEVTHKNIVKTMANDPRKSFIILPSPSAKASCSGG